MNVVPLKRRLFQANIRLNRGKISQQKIIYKKGITIINLTGTELLDTLIKTANKKN